MDGSLKIKFDGIFWILRTIIAILAIFSRSFKVLLEFSFKIVEFI